MKLNGEIMIYKIQQARFLKFPDNLLIIRILSFVILVM